MKKISLYSLVLLVVASIDSIRNLPATALFGSSLFFFFLFSALFFLFPTSLVSAELSSLFPEKGGVYHWVRMAFGEKWAMLAIWLQWINTMVWYPTILSFIAGTAAYAINPDLANHKGYLIAVILFVFWSLTFINLRGIQVSIRFNNICVLIGTIIPLLFLIALGAAWLILGEPLQIRMDSQSLIPTLSHSTSWISLIAIMASFLGMELSGVHVNDIHNPQRNFPKAMLISSLFILFSMLFGSLTIAFVLPSDQINLVSGVMQVFTNFFAVFGFEKAIPILTAAIVIGSVGNIVNWLISPAKGLLHAAEFGYLPPLLSRKNRHGVAAPILIAQGILVSLICLVFLLVPTVNAFYWFLTALSTELYMIMYVLMFLSALRLRYRRTDQPRAFEIPGGPWGIWLTCLFGLIGCSATIAVSFLPPDNVNIGSHSSYLLMICLGNVVTVAPILLFYWYKRVFAK